MVTFGFCQTGPRVRFPAPHPFLYILLVLLTLMVCCGRGLAVDFSAEAGDLDHYAAAPDTLVVAAASSDSLARVVGGDIFGHYWSSFGGNGQITAIDGVSMTGRADGVQELATATYSTFKGVEAAISSAGSEQSNWLQLIYGTLQQQGDLGTVYTRLLEVLTILQKTNSYSAYFGETRYTGLSIPDLLAAISFNQNMYLGDSGSFLYPDGTLSPVRYDTLFHVTSTGLRGLAYLMFGDESHPIYGLSYTGADKEGVRGSWSLADITANGMQGLATLIGGQDSGDGRKAVWYWTDPTDPTASQRTYEVSSLFDMFWLLGQFQNSLAKLEYVYASEEDIEFKQDEKPNMDAVKDSFFGNGEGAVNPDQIKDAAGISSAAKDAFGGAGSPGDAFTAINDSQSFWFFSQEVADALDTVNAPALVSEEEDDFMDQFVQDEDGFYFLIDLSPWDVSLYLGGER